LLVSLAGPASAVAADAPPGASSCSGCHATSAEVQTPMPRLVSRPAVEIVTAMQAFRMGQHQATVMDRIARGFS
jgi:cytochrome subunit of sulfide dehydrogenase